MTNEALTESTFSGEIGSSDEKLVNYDASKLEESGMQKWGLCN